MTSFALPWAFSSEILQNLFHTSLLLQRIDPQLYLRLNRHCYQFCMAKFNSRPDDDWRISYEGIRMSSMETIRECRRCGRRSRLIGQTSVLYDDDCMAACGCLGIYDMKSAGFTFRSFMRLIQANKMIAQQENDFWEDCKKRYSSIKLLKHTFE